MPISTEQQLLTISATGNAAKIFATRPARIDRQLLRERLAHLFDRLYRVDRSRTRTRGGSGLGLSICKSIANALGGEIRAASGNSGGLRIEVELPLKG